MADFSASDLVTAAKARFGEATLRARIRGAAGDTVAADFELVRIANGVIARAIDAAVQIGWPLPGVWPPGSLDDDGTTDISGVPYSQIWPKNLLQHALDLFNWRTLSGLEGASDNQRKTGAAAEHFFEQVEMGATSIGVGGPTDTATPEPLAARDRCGRTNLLDGSQDKANVLDTFRGFGWDRFH
jgi:hypothetical protein